MDEVIGYVDVRSAEVATAAIASDVAQVHQDMLDADADASAAAASAAAAAGTLANAVKKTGEASQSIAGDIAVAGTLSGGVVTGTQVTVPDPVNNTDAANKKYVDDADALKLSITDVNNYAVGLSSNQKALGIKEGVWVGYKYTRPVGTTNGKWLRYMAIPTRYTITMTEIIGTNGNNGYCYAKAITSGVTNYARIYSIDNQPTNSGIKVAATINNNTNKLEFWIYESDATSVNRMDFYNIYTNDVPVTQAEYFNTEHDDLPSTGYTTPTYILGSA